MRALQPGWLIPSDVGLWVVDVFQPIAVVLEPGSGGLRHVVSWPEVPAPPVDAFPAVLGDGDSLWLQYGKTGPIVRVGREGLLAAGWVGGESSQQRLSACGPGVAWCTTPPPEAEFVRIGEQPRDFLGFGELRRVDARGVVETVHVGRGVHQLMSTPAGLLVGVVADTWSRRRWDQDEDRINRGTRWHRIPWDAAPPAELGNDFALPADFTPPLIPNPYDVAGHLVHAGGPAAHTEGLDWFLERAAEPAVNGRLWQRGALTARDQSGTAVASWDLGDGSVVAIKPWEGRVIVAVAREPRFCPPQRPGRVVDVIAVDARDGSRVDLLPAGSVDVAGRGWPLVEHLVEADSYVRWSLTQVQNRAQNLRLAGAQDVQSTLVGQWPTTLLETTMTVSARPGVRLRLRVPLFDELGRVLGPQYADAQFADSLGANFLPEAGNARDGFLDVW